MDVPILVIPGLADGFRAVLEHYIRRDVRLEDSCLPGLVIL